MTIFGELGILFLEKITFTHFLYNLDYFQDSFNIKYLFLALISRYNHYNELKDLMELMGLKKLMGLMKLMG